MAVTDDQKSETLTKADSDSQYVLGESGMNLDVQYRVAKIHSTRPRFQASADSRAEAGTAAGKDFGISTTTSEERAQVAALLGIRPRGCFKGNRDPR